MTNQINLGNLCRLSFRTKLGVHLKLEGCSSIVFTHLAIGHFKASYCQRHATVRAKWLFKHNSIGLFREKK